MTMPEPTPFPAPTVEDLQRQLLAKNAQTDQLIAQIDQLTLQRDVSLWLYKEIEYKVKIMAARTLMNRPDIQKKMQEMLIAQMDQQGAGFGL